MTMVVADFKSVESTYAASLNFVEWWRRNYGSDVGTARLRQCLSN